MFLNVYFSRNDYKNTKFLVQLQKNIPKNAIFKIIFRNFAL